MDNSEKSVDRSPEPGDLRELAQRIQDEQDPNKMIALVQQLLAKLDEKQLQRSQLRG